MRRTPGRFRTRRQRVSQRSPRHHRRHRDSPCQATPARLRGPGLLYRHRDLLGKIHALEAAPPAAAAPPARPSLRLIASDLLAAHERSVRLTPASRQLERRLSEALG